LNKQRNSYITNIFKYKNVYVLNTHFMASLSRGDVTVAISNRKPTSVRGFEALFSPAVPLTFFHTRTSKCSTFLLSAGHLPIKFPHPGTR
jgi:hypothetical protein